MIKIAGIVLITLILVIFLKDVKKEFAIIITIAAVILLFSIVAADFFEVVQRLSDLSSRVKNMQTYINLMIKILGISLLAQFLSDLCRDTGENALANQTEIVSKISILIMTLPLFETVITIVTGLLK